VEHSAEAATFMVVGGKSMRNTLESERTPLAESAASEQAWPHRRAARPVLQPIGRNEPLLLQNARTPKTCHKSNDFQPLWRIAQF